MLSEWTRVSIKTKQTSPYRLWQKYMAPGSGSIKGNAWKSSRWNFIPVEIKPKLWKVKVASHVWLFAALWDIQSMEFSRPEYWSGQPFPSPGDHPNPGIEPRSPTSQAYSLPGKTPGKPQNTGVDSYPFSSGSSWPQNWTRFSCIAGGFFTSCAIREAYNYSIRANQRKYLKELRLKFYSYRNKTKAVSPFNHSYISLGQPLRAAGNEYVYRE